MTRYIPRSRPSAGGGERIVAGMSRATVMVGLAVVMLACDTSRVLDVDDPDVVRPGNLKDKAALPALRNGVLGSLQVAYSGGADLSNGGHEGIIQLGGMFADELINAETFTDRINVDKRDVLASNGSMVALYLDLARARAAAASTVAKYEALDPGTDGQAEMLAVEGMLYVLFGEHYCSGVVFSEIDENEEIVYGEPQTRDQIFTTAVEKFDEAIAIAVSTGNAELENLARVGKGRALVNLAQFANAATAVSGVPTDFVYAIEASNNSDRQRNGIWHYAFNNGSFSVADNEGGVGLPFASADDPRVPILDTGGPGFDNTTPLIVSMLYPSSTTPTPLATGVEARLIEAEAALRGGSGPGMMTILNALRGGAGITPATDPVSQAGREDLLFQERAYWMYLTAHRLGDMRRLVRQYGRPINSVYPNGEYFKGGDYGTDVNLPVSADERNNPNFQACLDRDP